MQVAACPRCASLDLRPATLSDGVALGGGETSFLVCHACAFRGSPMVLADEAAYIAFRSALGGAGDADRGLEDEPVPPEVAAVAGLPAPAPPRATAWLVGAIGVALMAFGAFVAAAGLVAFLRNAPTGFAWPFGVVAAAVGIAVVRAAQRMREHSPAMTQAP